MDAKPKGLPKRPTNGHGVELPVRPRPDLVPKGETREQSIRAVLEKHREALEILAKR